LRYSLKIFHPSMTSTDEPVSPHPNPGARLTEVPQFHPPRKHPLTVGERAAYHLSNPGPEILTASRDGGPERVPGCLPTSSHSSPKVNPDHLKPRRSPPRPNQKLTWGGPIHNGNLTATPLARPSYSGGGTGSLQNSPSHRPKPNVGVGDSALKSYTYTQAQSKFNPGLGFRDEAWCSPPSSNSVTRSPRGNSHHRSYSMFAEPLFNGKGNGGYPEPIREPIRSHYPFPPTDAKPPLNTSHPRLSSNRLPSNSHPPRLEQKLVEPLSHSFNSRSEGGREVFYFELPAAATALAFGQYDSGPTLGRFEPNAKPADLVPSHGSRSGGERSCGSCTSNYGGSKNPWANHVSEGRRRQLRAEALSVDRGRSLGAAAKENLGSCAEPGPLQRTAARGTFGHKRCRGMSGSLDSLSLEQLAPPEAPQPPSELLGLGNETVELYQLLVNYRNPWGTRSLDEGPISKEATDDPIRSPSPSCEEGGVGDETGDGGGTTLSQEPILKITRVQTWLSQTVACKGLADIAIPPCPVSERVGEAASPSQLGDLYEFDGDVLIGDFFSGPEARAARTASDDGSRTHVDLRGAAEADANRFEGADAAGSARVKSLGHGSPPDSSTAAGEFKPVAVFSSSRPYERRPPTPDFEDLEAGNLASSSPQPLETAAQVRTYSPRTPTPEELSDFDRTVASVLGAAGGTALQGDSLGIFGALELHPSIHGGAHAKGDEQQTVGSVAAPKPEANGRLERTGNGCGDPSGSEALLDPILADDPQRSPPDPCFLLAGFFEPAREDGSEPLASEAIDPSGSGARNRTASGAPSEKPASDAGPPLLLSDPPPLPAIAGRFCFDTPLGPRKLVWRKGVLPQDAAAEFCARYGITHPQYVAAALPSQSAVWALGLGNKAVGLPYDSHPILRPLTHRANLWLRRQTGLSRLSTPYDPPLNLAEALHTLNFDATYPVDLPLISLETFATLAWPGAFLPTSLPPKVAIRTACDCAGASNMALISKGKSNHPRSLVALQPHAQARIPPERIGIEGANSRSIGYTLDEA
ncbi:hypothetical protein L0F63_006733, partial [Massospora cicadina]